MDGLPNMSESTRKKLENLTRTPGPGGITYAAARLEVKKAIKTVERFQGKEVFGNRELEELTHEDHVRNKEKKIEAAQKRKLSDPKQGQVSKAAKRSTSFAASKEKTDFDEKLRIVLVDLNHEDGQIEEKLRLKVKFTVLYEMARQNPGFDSKEWSIAVTGKQKPFGQHFLIKISRNDLTKLKSNGMELKVGIATSKVVIDGGEEEACVEPVSEAGTKDTEMKEQKRM